LNEGPRGRVGDGYRSAKELEHLVELGDKSSLIRDGHKPRMGCPDFCDARVDASRFARGFDAKWILVVVPVLRRRRAEVNDQLVTPQLFFERCANLAQEVAGALGPIGDAVERSAITKDYTLGIFLDGDVLELTLHMKDGALRGTAPSFGRSAWKSAAENDARGFGEHYDMVVKLPSDDFQDCRLSCAWSPSQDDHAGHRSSSVVGRAFIIILCCKRVSKREGPDAVSA